MCVGIFAFVANAHSRVGAICTFSRRSSMYTSLLLISRLITDRDTHTNVTCLLIALA